MKVDKIKKNASLITYIILFVIIILPLYVKYSKVMLSESEMILYGSEFYNDMFSKQRGNLLVIAGALSLISLIGDYIISKTRRIKFSWPIIIVCLYGGLIALSTLFSNYHLEAMRGTVDRYEGFWVLMSYCIVFISSYIVAKNNKLLNLKWMIVISSSIISSIGWFQLFGFNILNTSIMLKFVVGVKNFQYLDKSPFLEVNQAYSTLGNPNIVGNYLSLIIPYLFYLLLNYKITKDRKESKIGFIVLSSAFVLNVGFLVGAQSLGGFVGISFCLIVGTILFFRKRENKNRLIYILILIFSTSLILELLTPYEVLIKSEVLISVMGSVVAGIVLFLLKKIKLSKKSVCVILFVFVLTITSAGMYYKYGEWNRDYFLKDDEIFFKNIDITGSELKIDFNLQGGNSFTLWKKQDHFYYKFNGSEHLELKLKNNETFKFSDVKLNKFSLKVISQEKYDVVLLPDLDIGFTLINGKFSMINSGKYMVGIEKPSSIGINGLEKLGNGRFYIWSHTIPMIKDTIFIGGGPDVYVHMFPQYDLVGKLNMGHPLLIIDKPHNWYLQLAINTGFTSLILIILLLGFLFKLLIGDGNYEDSDTEIIRAFGLGIVAYHITMLFNDSSVITAPMFWAFYGIEFGLLSKYNDFAPKKIIKRKRSQLRC